jgi:separase
LRALVSQWRQSATALLTNTQPEHIILILDKSTQFIPWESLPILRHRSVSRLPSWHFLHERLDAVSTTLARERTSFVLNPQGDLPDTQHAFASRLEA